MFRQKGTSELRVVYEKIYRVCVTWSERKLKAGMAVGRLSGYPKPRLSAGLGSEDERAGTIKVG